MYIPEPIWIGMLLLLMLMFGMCRAAYVGRDIARKKAEELHQKLKERPIQRIVYSDDVIESKIIDLCEHRQFYEFAQAIRNKDYLK